MSILAFSTIFCQLCQYVGVHVNFEVNVFMTFEQCQKNATLIRALGRLGLCLKESGVRFASGRKLSS